MLKAPADGHTLWVGTQSMVTINPSAYARLPWKPSDFHSIVKGVAAPLVLVTHMHTGVMNVRSNECCRG